MRVFVCESSVLLFVREMSVCVYLCDCWFVCDLSEHVFVRELSVRLCGS